MARSVARTRDVRGIAVPSFFYGTAWKEDRTRELTESALAAGFTAVDTANQRRHYVEAAVGEAVAAHLAAGGGARGRGELFLQTKFTFARGQDHRIPYDRAAGFAEQVAQSLDSSLAHLGTTYVDSYLLHGPWTGDGLHAADWEVWRAMEDAHDAGKARLIGVSNVALAQLAALCAGARVQPAFVQNRCYARAGWDRDVRTFCAAHGIAYQGFSLLTANERELRRPPIARVVERAGRTLPAVVFRFALQVGIIPLTGTSSPAHMREDLSCFDFELDDAAVAAIEQAA